MNSKNIIDLFFFKEKKDGKPEVTTGAIIWGTLLRSFLILIISFFIIKKYFLYDYLIILIFILWFFVGFPAYKAYQNFNKEMENFSESTLCGSCRYFEKSAQLCKIYDQHPTKDIIPCEGLNWEPKQFDN